MLPLVTTRTGSLGDYSAGHQTKLRSAATYGLTTGIGALLGYAIAGTSKGALIGGAAAFGWEVAWMLYRRRQRDIVYEQALAHAQSIGKPLVVIGAPDRGRHTSLCGDVMIDIAPSSACPLSIQADIGKRIPLPDNSAVVYIAYVLEYVDDLARAVSELQRIAPGRVYLLRIQPWTATAYLYEGARRLIPSDLFPTPTPP